MTPNPLLLSKLFLKHQPAAKTFEEAVAMEVESLKAEWASIDDELSALAAKERELLGRKNELLDIRRQLLGSEHTEPVRERTPEPVPLFKRPDLPAQDNRHVVAVRRREPSGGRPSRLRGDGQVESKYASNQYSYIARSLGIGTNEGTGVTWLTVDEHAAVYRQSISDDGGATGNPARQDAPSENPITQTARIRAGTNVEERLSRSRMIVNVCADMKIGTPSNYGVWLTKDEYAIASRERNVRSIAAARESRESRIRGGSGSTVERKYTSKEYRSVSALSHIGTQDESCVWLTDSEADTAAAAVRNQQAKK